MLFRWTPAARVVGAVVLCLSLGPRRPSGAVSTSGVTLDEARELHGAGRLDEARVAYREVLRDGQLDASSQAVAHNNLCVILDQFGDYRAAERECREALRLRRGLGEAPRLSRSLNNLGLTLQHLGSYAEAEAVLREALVINRDNDDLAGQAINLANLGAVATVTGRFEDALRFHSSVAELASLHSDEWWAREQLQTARLNRGVVLERLGAHREALDLYRDLLEKSDELSSAQRASVQMNLGVVYRNLGDPLRAIVEFEGAEKIYVESGDSSSAAHARLNIGIARHLNLEDFEAAEASYRKALEAAAKSGDRLVETDTLVFLGQLLLGEGRSDEAREVFGRGGRLAEESGTLEGVWSSQTGLGEVELAVGDLEAALAHFESAIAAIEGGRREAPAGSYRESFFADKRRAYSGAVLTLAEMDRRQDDLGYAGRALEIAQRAKARDLLDALGTRDLGVSPLDGVEIGRRLGRDVLLEYFVAADQVLVWRVSGRQSRFDPETSTVQMSRVGAAEPLLGRVKILHRELSEGRAPPRQELKELAASLLAVAVPLPEDDATLFIAPDKGIRYLPFELLPQGRGGDSLLESATVAYLPSAWALPSGAGRGSAERAVGLLGFGGVELTEPHNEAYLTSGLTLEPLPASLHELGEISRRFKGENRVLTGEAATEQAFHEASRRGAAVTHFATHTAVGESRRLGAAVLLSPHGGEDGMLYPREIASAEVGSSLVVLAACSSALGATADGQALTSLTGSFLAAGAESVLATLWDVGDQPTSIFMGRFYEFLSRGSSPAEALRRTKLQFLADEQWSAPHLWSGYVLVGVAPPIDRVFRVQSSTWVLTVAILLLALAWASGAVRARARENQGAAI
ncbi:MAG: CHAT domain-containing tetratricopeptide repeat protein [Acidobacteriota bacterium]|nr:CHAT domain-containing tetratricopeptide repeat protein [Acidobacteriota bacterium]